MPEVAPYAFKSFPVSSTPIVTAPSICTEPSISTASRLVVPSMSALPDISRVAASNSPDKVMLVAPVIAPSNATAPLISTVVSDVIVSTPS